MLPLEHLQLLNQTSGPPSSILSTMSGSGSPWFQPASFLVLSCSGDSGFEPETFCLQSHLSYSFSLPII